MANAGTRDTAHLTYVSGPLPAGDGPICLLVIHNERNVVEDLLDHVCGLGELGILAVDDHSTDGTCEVLRDHERVTLYQPRPGSEYRNDKRDWRGELLDRYGVGRWCLTPDADERLVWFDCENRSFSQLLNDLDLEGAEAFVADMVDMYDDRPLKDHIAGPGPLVEQFPFFDDPVKDPMNYRVMLSPSRRYRLAHPTPPTESHGGMRDRLFGHGMDAHGPFGRLLLRDSIAAPRHVSALRRPFEVVKSKLLKPMKKPYPNSITKLALVKWRAGLRFSGGPHHISAKLPLSREKGAYLHFPITRGKAGLSYIGDRGQHSRAGKYYNHILGQGQAALDASPVYPGSTRYTSSRDLGPLLVGPHGCANT